MPEKRISETQKPYFLKTKESAGGYWQSQSATPN